MSLVEPAASPVKDPAVPSAVETPFQRFVGAYLENSVAVAALALFCLIVVLALLLWFASLIYEFLGERENLTKLRQNQETTLTNAQKMRGQLDAIASGTQKLALAGNPNALQVVSESRSQAVLGRQ